MNRFWRRSKDPLHMTYMGDIDTALHRRGDPWAFLLSLTVGLFFVVLYLWADYTMLDDVVRGNGKIIPAAGVRDIQSDKGGSISELRVKEGDNVEANQVVAVVANMQHLSALRELQQRSIELELSLVRLKAEAESLPLEFPEDMQKSYPEIVQNQMHIYTSNLQRFEGEDRQMRAQIEQRKHEVEAAEESRSGLENSLEILRAEEKAKKSLVGSSVSLIEFLNLQERIITTEGQLNGIQQTIARAQSAAMAAEVRMETREAERQTAIAIERNKNRVDMEAINQRIMTWADQVNRAELRSPVAGTVKAIHFKEGGVAQPADVIMEIIAADDVLEIDARFAPSDRGFLYLSQKGMAKFSSYNFTIYGGLEATVIRISDDTILDKRGEPWYEVRLITSRKSISYRGSELPILPGMTVSIDLLTDKRSVLERLSGPLSRAQENALTEH